MDLFDQEVKTKNITPQWTIRPISVGVTSAVPNAQEIVIPNVEQFVNTIILLKGMSGDIDPQHEALVNHLKPHTVNMPPGRTHKNTSELCTECGKITTTTMLDSDNLLDEYYTHMIDGGDDESFLEKWVDDYVNVGNQPKVTAKSKKMDAQKKSVNFDERMNGSMYTQTSTKFSALQK